MLCCYFRGCPFDTDISGRLFADVRSFVRLLALPCTRFLFALNVCVAMAPPRDAARPPGTLRDGGKLYHRPRAALGERRRRSELAAACPLATASQARTFALPPGANNLRSLLHYQRHRIAIMIAQAPYTAQLVQQVQSEHVRSR